MEIRFQADEDLKETIIPALKRHAPRIDFLTAFNAGIKGMTDLQVLGVAAQLGRVLVTHHLKTMPCEFAEFIQTHDSPGVLIITQDLPLATAAEELFLIWSEMESEDWVNRICILPL